jgi:hypothetical protein
VGKQFCRCLPTKLLYISTIFSIGEVGEVKYDIDRERETYIASRTSHSRAAENLLAKLSRCLPTPKPSKNRRKPPFFVGRQVFALLPHPGLLRGLGPIRACAARAAHRRRPTRPTPPPAAPVAAAAPPPGSTANFSAFPGMGWCRGGFRPSERRHLHRSTLPATLVRVN